MAKIELRNHPKWKRVVHELRDDVIEVHLLGHYEAMLHSSYAQNSPDFLDADELEFAVGWVGEPGRFATAFVRWRLVDEVEVDGRKKLRIHDWVNHLPRTILRRKAVGEWAAAAGMDLPPSASRSGVNGQGHAKPPERPDSGRPQTPTPEQAAGQCPDSGRTVSGQRPDSVRPPAPYPDLDLDPDPDLDPDSSRSPPAGDGGKSPSPKKVLLDHYHDEFVRVRGEKPVITGGKDTKILSQLLTGRELAEAEWIVTEFLENPPAWYATRGMFEPEHIVSAANRIISRRPPPGKGVNGWQWGYTQEDTEQHGDADDWEEYLEAHVESCGWGGELASWPAYDEWKRKGLEAVDG